MLTGPLEKSHVYISLRNYPGLQVLHKNINIYWSLGKKIHLYGSLTNIFILACPNENSHVIAHGGHTPYSIQIYKTLSRYSLQKSPSHVLMVITSLRSLGKYPHLQNRLQVLGKIPIFTGPWQKYIHVGMSLRKYPRNSSLKTYSLNNLGLQVYKQIFSKKYPS